MSNSYRIVSASVSDRGLSEKRPQNEDSFLEIANCGIFAVADGVGGASAGEVASQMAMEILGEAFTNLREGSDAEEVMQIALHRANAAIYQMSHDLTSLSSMATTVVALHLADNIATIGHVGDSRLYRIDIDGLLHRETDDHSVVAEEVRAGRMTQQQAENHPSRNIISRALGAEPTVEVELKTIMFDAGESFLICSDGVTRHIGDPEIRGILASGAEPSQIVSQIRELCFERGAEDNLTAVLVKAQPISNGNDVSRLRPLVIDEEPTVATPRSPYETRIENIDGHDELLELETRELKMPVEIEDEREAPETPQEPVVVFEPDFRDQLPVPMETGSAPDWSKTMEPASPFDLKADTVPPTEPSVDLSEHNQPEDRSAMGDYVSDISEPDTMERKERGTLGKIVSSVFLLLLGSVVGLAGYHFILLPTMLQSNSAQITEMKSDNIPVTSYERNRRNVDRDPAGYIEKVTASPQQQPDSIDYYLRGRAYLLLEDFPKAHTELINARNRLASTEPDNVDVLTTDIAMALVFTNQPTVQSLLKKEIESTKPGSITPANSNTAVNTAGNAVPKANSNVNAK